MATSMMTSVNLTVTPDIIVPTSDRQMSPPYGKANNKSPPLLSQDLSRRKQRKPKSLTSPGHSSSVSGENETVKEEPNDNIDQNNMELQLNTTEDSDLDTGQDSAMSPGIPGIDDVTRKWNMFPFGEVTVPHHPPGVPIVPLALQMVYLYPLGREEGGEGVRYRMLVPTGNAAAASPHLLMGAAGGNPEPAVSPPLSSSGRQHWPHHGGKRSPVDDIGVPERSRSVHDPLDLTNKSPEPSENAHDNIKEEVAGPSLSSHPSGTSLAPPPPLVNNSNRCNECNINFSKFSNYQAHKKYYCSGSKGGRGGESEGVSPPPNSSSKFNVQVPKSKSPQSGSNSNASSSSSGSHQQLSEAAGEPSKAAGDVRELVMKQQEALLASLKCLPPRPLLMANPRLPVPPLQQQAMSFACNGCGICFKSISNLQAHQSRYCAGMNKKTEEMKFLEALIKSASQPPTLAAQPAPSASSMLTSPRASSSSPTSSANSPPYNTAAATAAAALLAAGLPTASLPPGLGAAAGMPGLSEILAMLSSRSSANSAGPSLAEKSDGDKERGEGVLKKEESISDEVFCRFCGIKESKEKLIDHIYSHVVEHVKKRKSEEELENGEIPEKRIKPNDLVKQEEGISSKGEDIKSNHHHPSHSHHNNNISNKGDKSPTGGGGSSSAVAQQPPTAAAATAPKNPGYHCEFCGIRFSQPAAHSAHVQYYCQKKVKTE